jgi:hypothetical protein
MIYPNPFSSETNLVFSRTINHGILAITDVSGKTIINISFTGNHHVLEKGDLKPGFYFARITSTSDPIMIIKKIIVQ